MIRRALLLFVLLFCGCQFSSGKVYHTQGYVRSLWVSDHCRWTIVIEGEDGVVFSIHSYECSVPPVWQGLHGEFQYELDPDYGGNSVYKNFIVLRRLP